jgi:hypothetical protein
MNTYSTIHRQLTTLPPARLRTAMCAFCTLLVGCQSMFFLTDPNKGKPVPAEYNKIGHSKVAVLVWADQSTLDIDPKARRRVCEAVIYDMKKNLPDASFVAARETQDLQETSGLNWESMSSAEICKHLKCDMVLRVDLLEYTTRTSDTKELRRGRVRGTISLYQCGAGGSEDAAYQSEIVTTYPTQTPGGISDLSDADLLREATVQFGQSIARKFYDHEVSMRGPENR